MSVAWISQPLYLGWDSWYIGLERADVCVLLDTVELSRQSAQQRARIRLKNGSPAWLTVPIHAHNNTLIQDVEIDNSRNWHHKHWATLQQAYQHTPHWPPLARILEPVYQTQWLRLAALNEALIRALATHLNITTPILVASELGATRAGKIERLQDLLHHANADTLLEPRSGAYLKHAPFQVQWFDHPHSHLSVVDQIARNRHLPTQ